VIKPSVFRTGPVAPAGHGTGETRHAARRATVIKYQLPSTHQEKARSQYIVQCKLYGGAQVSQGVALRLMAVSYDLPMYSLWIQAT
jgi:hypothetical protein